jgi:hypothetical protein
VTSIELRRSSRTPRRMWVHLTEAAEGGWGIAGTAFGREEFTSAAERRAACDVEDPGAAHEDV